MEILNRKAKHDYFIEEVYEAGIVLTGTEIKSIRNGNCNIKDCYGIIRNHEVYLLNMFVFPYKEGNIFNHEETRNRKLLLKKEKNYFDFSLFLCFDFLLFSMFSLSFSAIIERIVIPNPNTIVIQSKLLKVF